MMIGNFNKRVQLQNATVTKSASGGTTHEYALFATVWAMVEQKASKPVEGGSQNNLERTVFITIRYSSAIRTNLSKDTRMVLASVNYAVVGLKDIEKDYVRIEAKAIANTL
jgi:SPP1 family predicted phage head-tail adaptor